MQPPWLLSLRKETYIIRMLIHQHNFPLDKNARYKQLKPRLGSRLQGLPCAVGRITGTTRNLVFLTNCNLRARDASNKLERIPQTSCISVEGHCTSLVPIKAFESKLIFRQALPCCNSSSAYKHTGRNKLVGKNFVSLRQFLQAVLRYLRKLTLQLSTWRSVSRFGNEARLVWLM